MAKQAIRSRKGQREERTFDQTSLTYGSYGVRIHRDYAAHFFRWGFAKRFIKKQGMHVLDVGCGPDFPLVKLLCGAQSNVPERYVGVDMNKLARVPGIAWSSFKGSFDATNAKAVKALGTFDVIISLEVIEHMSAASGKKMLKALRQVIRPGGVFLLSTPVFNGAAARNHLHEYTIPELQRVLEQTGWAVKDRFGTFASQRDLKPVLSPAERKVQDELMKYYDNDVLACFLAPLHPDQARNNIWILEGR